ncbi:tRNA (N6-threonylcarbamoyladenosine(37)-N6)-methyltransferase TrmO [Roseibium sp.]|uniref:tRNA (N6-threonylcarbamoyladenosine(37)-N6)-methyltransferase TrmO n=1 Tax=Roseibium sp. TaxID=1936156 RepID=UPI003BB089A5
MSDIRPHEVQISVPEPKDARLYFIGRIRTPWTDRKACPRQGKEDGPDCQVEIFEPWVPALQGIEDYARIELLYWLNQARRDLVIQNPGHNDGTFGTFALRSPVRPNPIGTSLVKLVSVDGPVLTVRGLDCLDGTPLVDVKPDRCSFTPKAPPKD